MSVFTLEKNNECLPKVVQTDNASSGIMISSILKHEYELLFNSVTRKIYDPLKVFKVVSLKLYQSFVSLLRC